MTALGFGRLRWLDARNAVGPAASAKPPNRRLAGDGYRRAAVRPAARSKAYAVAAARDETPSLPKMLLTCRSTVRSLSTSFSAIARLVAPVATSRSTSSSRGLSSSSLPVSRARSGVAPSSAKIARAPCPPRGRRTRGRPGRGRPRRAGRGCAPRRTAPRRGPRCRAPHRAAGSASAGAPRARQTDACACWPSGDRPPGCGSRSRGPASSSARRLGRVVLTDGEQDLGRRGEDLDALAGLVASPRASDGPSRPPPARSRGPAAAARARAAGPRRASTRSAKHSSAESNLPGSRSRFPRTHGRPAGRPLVRVREAHRGRARRAPRASAR